MKLKRILLSSISAILFFVFAFSQNIAYAEITTNPIYLGVTERMSNNNVDLDNKGNKGYLGYAIGDPNANTSTNIYAAKIWNIVRYSSAAGSDPTDASIFCLKAGVGFSDTKKSETYNVFYNMKTEKEAIKSQNDTLKSIVEGEIELDDGSKISKYNAILAMLDNFYIKGQSAPEEKDALLQAASIESEYWDEILNEDDVKAVQQAALWYFTNYGDSVYDKTNNTGWLNYTTDENTYTSYSSYNPTGVPPAGSIGAQKQTQAEMLYKYLIRKAKENAVNYSNNEANPPATIETTTLEYESNEDNYIVGPIKITENENSIPYTIGLEVKNGDNVITGYSLLDENKRSTNKGIKDLVGKDFYISVPKSSVTISNLKAEIKFNYSNTKLTLWGSSTNNVAQPVVIPEKETKSIPIILTTAKRNFDLSLRKYITKVNDKTLTGNESRVPSIEESTLQTGTTATYKHKKDPVTIKKGDIVTYKITIYNEGQKYGRATRVVDQLPEGLKFKNIISGNFEFGSYNLTDNILNLIRNEENTDNLAPYESGKLDSETIEITCEVTADPDSHNSKILTNIAWISEEIDSESNIRITNQVGADRDSEPDTIPNTDNLPNYTGNGNKSDLTDSNYYYKGQQDDDDFEKLILMPETFDLKLIKRIEAVNNQNVPERIEKVDVSKLNTTDEDGNLITTGDYKLNKEPVGVKKGDIVTYTFTVYNEGSLDGYASEITENIPEGLEFLWSEKEGEELKNDTTLTKEEKEAIAFNQAYLWGNFVYDDAKEKIIQVSTDALSRENEIIMNSIPEDYSKEKYPYYKMYTNLLLGYDSETMKDGPDHNSVSIKLKVVADDISGKVIRNEAAITKDTDSEGNDIDDRDSSTDKWVKYEDDEDYDNIILQSFDLSLRKFIIAVSDDTKIDSNEYLKNSDGSYKRAPVVDTSKLNTKDENGNLITTAIYNHTKEPVQVEQNDIVVYMLRVYNEGEIDGYASEIKDHLPPHLEYVDGDFNKQYGWTVSSDGRTVTTKYLKDSKINKAIQNADGKYVLEYKEVPIMCKVKATAKTNENITNIADITEYLDDNKNKVTDRDSQQNNVILPSDENLPSYKDDEKGEYVPGQEDDDDFEKVIIPKKPDVPVEEEKEFDLSLRKFIIAVSDDTKIDSNEYLKNSDGSYKRAPVVDTSKLNTKDENGNLITTAIYNHTKEPVQVEQNDIVVYMLRVYNEGEIDGYASEIKDHLPPHLEYVDGDFNKKYGWEVSKDGRTVTTRYLEDQKIKAAEIVDTEPQKILLSYKEVPIMCKVKDTAKSNENITNIADITKYLDENKKEIKDRDSQENNVVLPKDEDLPSYKNDEKGNYIPGQQDDDDFEKVIVKTFDLALRKWVTQAILIENGQQTVKNTGHQPYDDPEQVVKVELHRKKLNQVTVKFKYSIRVINEGDVEGYAKEVTDYIPEGLKFVAADNPGWTDEGNNVISTKLLENKLLKPGEYADVEVLLTWVNSENNMGIKVNTAEISKDYNEYGLPDKDSTPDNKKQGEDDIDDAPVMISISTGQIRIYFTLGFIVLITIAGGVILIKKYVI